MVYPFNVGAEVNEPTLNLWAQKGMAGAIATATGADQAALQAAFDMYINTNGVVQNVKPSNTRKWRTALSRYRAGLANATIAVWGDSTMRGVIDSGGTAQFPNASSIRFGEMMTRNGEAVETQSIFGSGHVANTTGSFLSSADSRVVDTGTMTNALQVVGGLAWYFTATGLRTITPLVAWDTVIIYYASASGSGTISYEVNSAGATNIVAAGTPSQIKSVSVAAGSVGLHALKLAWVSGNTYIIGVRFYNSTRKAVEVINIGASGARSVDLAVNNNAPWDPKASITSTVAPHLTIIEGGVINDCQQGTAIPTMVTALQTLIDAALVTGDAMLATPVYNNGVTEAVQLPYVNAVRALAVTNDIPLIDFYSYRGAFAAATGLYSGAVHGSIAGYADDAALMFRGPYLLEGI